MAPTQRDEKFQIRVTTEERKMLEAIADRDGLSASDKLRQLIRQDHARGRLMVAGVSLDAEDVSRIWDLPKAKVLSVIKSEGGESEKVVAKLRQIREKAAGRSPKKPARK